MVSARHSHRLLETVVSRRALALGRKVKELPVPEGNLKVSIIALSRGGKPIDQPLSEVRVKAGDIAILEVDEEFFGENQRSIAFSLVRRLTGARIKRYDRAVYASLITIAMVVAGNLGVNGMPFAITVMVGASCSFISPMGYQTNLMVYGPGGYKFTDFVKIGVPMSAVVGIITILLAPLVWPF
jgi:hypothetical protein